ncbi:MAG TPA: DUF6084 family protein [Solirubrobacteraceae bacterium]|nr:DUF6084 family protein [Solirubrobacteraceae bacterium]
MSTHVERRPAAPAAIPAPEFAVLGATHLRFAAAPTMVFEVTATEPGGREIQSMSLSVQVMIDPARRGYDAATRERLIELFGPPAGWAPSTQALSWARVAAAVPGFAGETEFALELPCTYDLEVAAAKYFYALADGIAPLSFHFSGTVFYAAEDGRLQMAPVPWSSSARFEMPVSAWREMIAEHYSGGGWIRLDACTLQALNARRAARGLTFANLIGELLDGD